MSEMMSALRAKLIGRLGCRTGESGIPRRGEEPVPLSPDQERLWLARQFNPNGASHHIANAFRIEGELNVAALMSALGQLMLRHESLRAAVPLGCNGPQHQFVAETALPLTLDDFSSHNGGEREHHLAARLYEVANAPFELASAPLWRAALIRLGEHEYVLGLTLHHLIADGWSCAVLMRELATAYRAACGDPGAILPQPPVQFGDWVLWLRRKLAAGDYARDANYWRAQLADAPRSVVWPTQVAATRAQSSGYLPIELTGPQLSAVRQLAQQHQVTPFAVLLAALDLVLARYSKQTDFLIATPVSARLYPQLQDTVGFLANTLLYRSRAATAETSSSLVAECGANLLEAQDHQGLPFAEVAAQYPAVAGHSFQVNVMFSLLPAMALPDFGACTLKRLPLQTAEIDFDLFLVLEEQADTISGYLGYRTAALAQESAQGLAEAFKAAVALLCDETRALADYQLPPALLQSAPVARRLTVNGNFTVEPIVELLRGGATFLDMPLAVEALGFNQVFQELLNPASDSRRNHGGTNLLVIRLSDWLPTGIGNDAIAGQLREMLNQFREALSVAVAGGRASWVVVRGKEYAGTRLPLPLQAEVDGSLADLCESLPGLSYIEPAEVDHYYPVAEYADPIGEREGSLPYTGNYCAALALSALRRVHALSCRPLKVIVLDCDNTLWGGVCGEDGVRHLRVDEGYRHLQTMMLEQKRAGVLLCLASKNDEADVRRVFEQRTDMPLSLADFVAIKVNWEPKSANIRELSAALGLGLDSFLFIDDNPVECAEVATALPAVAVLQLPQDAASIRQMLDHCWALDRLCVTAEDANRSESYKREAERDTLRRGASSFAEFIAALDLEIDIHSAGDAELERVAQLTLRTTQFNTTGVTRTSNELAALQQDDAHDCLAIRVKDCFGDYGLVGVLLLRRSGSVLVIEALLLSCRVLGRGVEHAMLRAAAQQAVRHGCSMLEVPLTPTARNAPVRRFLGGLRQYAHVRCDQAGEPVSYQFDVRALVDLKLDLGSYDQAQDELAPAAQAAGGTDLARAKRLQLVQRGLSSAAQLSALAVTTTAPRSPGKGVPPLGPLETRLLELWRALLSAEGLGVTDNFFDMGGTSLLMVRLSGQLQQALEREVSVILLFQYPTIRSLATFLDGTAQSRLDSVVARGQFRRDSMMTRMRQQAHRPADVSGK
ncbi:HAD-IIIC family phosphatase [Chitinolyticbacter albus]|uniref:HAD-IIIC family phosphatase n=1 Tax=Chitinolyticbacter albus TaxID=2961951 RepID=UPI00210F15CB|nr:HAD-IIIC family phosphatase [Chitinolyticbacter albus]